LRAPPTDRATNGTGATLPPIEPDKRPWNDAEDRILFAPLLSKEESLELAEVLHTNPETLTRSITLEEIEARTLARKPDFVVRTVPRIIDGLEGDLLRLTGCQTKPERQAIANVGFRPDGRARQITILKDDSLPEPCRRAAQVLFSLTVPKFAMPIPETYSEALVLPIEQDQVACADAPMPTEDNSQRPGGKIKAPVRVKKVNPVYPQSAQKERRDGVVLIEANISRTGCVVDASVIASPDPRLSAAALYAVIQWRYSPTLFDDKPVPVIMTVTVNFMLP
jgi:TonB family protein